MDIYNLFSDFIGEYVIVRCHHDDVYAGYLEKANGRVCVLRDSRRLSIWWCKKGVSLSAISQYGLNHEKSLIAPVVSKIALTENCEIILCSEEGKQSIINAEEASCDE